jgi:2-amino-4-hydroxy-6-hydroxymethyldihydropteridine diphosphokinase
LKPKTSVLSKNTLILLTGSNQEQPIKQIGLAHRLIERRIGSVRRTSKLYKTKAWGNENQPPFINQALCIETILPPRLCLKRCLEIEASMGRQRIKKWEPRIIDIDIIFYNAHILNSKELSIPHPHVQDRNFALACLDNIIPSFIHPVFKQSIHALMLKCTDTLKVVEL